jgi:hypothetical protein
MSNNIYSETLSEAVVNLHAQIGERAAVLSPEWPHDIYNKGHVAYETTHEFHWPIITLKTKPTRKYFHASIYRTSGGRYEVTAYVL